jgi:hypothetical protein
VQVETQIVGPVDATLPTAQEITKVLIGLKCDIADICGVDPGDIDVDQLSEIAFEVWGIRLSAEEVQQIKDVNSGACKALYIEMYGGDEEDARRMLGDAVKQKYLSRVTSSGGGSGGTVLTQTKTFFNVTYIIRPSANSPIVLNTPKDQNVLIAIQAKVAAAMAKAGTAEGPSLFPIMHSTWTDAMNVSSWNSLSFFDDSAVKPIAYVPGAAAAQQPEEDHTSSEQQDKLAITLGVSLGLCCGAGLLVMAIAFVVSRRRRREHEEEVQQAAVAAAQAAAAATPQAAADATEASPKRGHARQPSLQEQQRCNPLVDAASSTTSYVQAAPSVGAATSSIAEEAATVSSPALVDVDIAVSLTLTPGDHAPAMVTLPGTSTSQE